MPMEEQKQELEQEQEQGQKQQQEQEQEERQQEQKHEQEQEQKEEQVPGHPKDEGFLDKEKILMEQKSPVSDSPVPIANRIAWFWSLLGAARSKQRATRRSKHAQEEPGAA